jgi:hypothetical protein
LDLNRERSLFIPLAALLCACGSGRDVIPESHDVHGVAEDGGRRDPGDYEYIAKRTLAAVGIAEARGMDGATAARVIDRLADSLEACAEGLSSQGRLVDGAARIAAQIAPDGAPGGLALRIAPGDAVKANAILCFIAPFKLTSFPVAGPDDPPRGIAIEATWGPHLQGMVGLGADGGT